MTPKIDGIDHVHINVSDRNAAEAWYRRIMGLKRVEALSEWAVPKGPLTIENDGGFIHLALFESDDGPRTSAIAFRTDGPGFLDWKGFLESEGLSLRIADHKLSCSLYFSDPWQNQYEITTYDHSYVAGRLNATAN